MDCHIINANKAKLHPRTSIGSVVLAVSDLARSLTFYEQLLGFSVLEKNESCALLGTRAGVPLLGLIWQMHAQPQPRTTTGLYHYAIRVPDRSAFVRVYMHLIANTVRIAGSADHHVNEALYLSDPDGNGLEIYHDRPPEVWRGNDGQIDMRVDLLNLEQLLAEGKHDPLPWKGLPAATTIGHMHLRIGDLEKAEQFYGSLLGFTVTHRMPGALFFAAGDYHHHLGVNVWKTQNASPPSKDCAGLRFFTLQLPDRAALEQAQQRIQVAGVSFHERKNSISLCDPWNDGLLLSVERLSLDDLAPK